MAVPDGVCGRDPWLVVVTGQTMRACVCVCVSVYVCVNVTLLSTIKTL